MALNGLLVVAEFAIIGVRPTQIGIADYDPALGVQNIQVWITIAAFAIALSIDRKSVV